jgi:hypothetical protein
MGSIGLVLLIACANVASLMQFGPRAGAMSLPWGRRSAQGGGGLRELLGESLTLSFLGGDVGVGLALASNAVRC